MDDNTNKVNMPNRPLPPNLPKKLPQHLNPQQRPTQSPPQTAQTPPKEKSIEQLLSRTSSTQYTMTNDEPVDRVIHKDDKQIIREYRAKIANAKRNIKKAKQRLLFTDQHYNRLSNVYADGLPDSLWFYPHRKMRAIISRLDAGITLTTTTSHRGIITALIIIILIMAVIASGIYIAFIITRNLNPNDTSVVGDVVFNLEDTQSGTGKTTTSLDINNARLNQDIEVSPAVSNNTNTDLYVRFFIKLDYLLGKDYFGVDINDLSTSCKTDSEKWWLDSAANVVYYLDVLAPNEKIFVFDSFQINGDPSIEGAWSGKSVSATIQVEVCQKIGEGQEFPPSWNMVWYSMMVI